MSPRSPQSTRVLFAFAAVYIIWGSTYTAIHIAGENLPVPLISAARTLLSVVLVLLICLVSGKSLRVPPGEGPRLILIGLLFMSANNMLLTWGEKLIPSGLASLVVSTMPIMIALLETFLPGGAERLSKRGWLGTLLGTAGIVILMAPRLQSRHSPVEAAAEHAAKGTLILLAAAFAFAIGSVLSRRWHFQADTLVATGWQLGAAALFNTALALTTCDVAHAHWTVRGVAAIAYIGIFGSLIALMSFTYLLKNVAVTKVATYAFVNPVIAVLLGVLLLHERLRPIELLGTVIIIAAVAMVVLSRSKPGQKEIVDNAGEAVQ